VACDQADTIVKGRRLFLAFKVSLLLNALFIVVTAGVSKDSILSRAVVIITLPADFVGRWIPVPHPNAAAVMIAIVLSVALDTIIAWGFLTLYSYSNRSPASSR
jgi:hypothetical protein